MSDPARDNDEGRDILPSPAIIASLGAPMAAYEVKFLLSESKAQHVEAWASQHLAYDPHVDPARGNTYHTTSVYLDTAALDIFHGRAPFRRRKFRIRRYGTEPRVYLERKSRTGDRVRKRRTLIGYGELGLLHDPTFNHTWPGCWFHRRLHVRRLRPTCQISYVRAAFMGENSQGPLRLTLDRQVRCAPASAWSPSDPQGELPLLTGEVVLELKFRDSLPTLYKRLMHELALIPGVVSKYRLAVQAWGLDTASQGVG